MELLPGIHQVPGRTCGNVFLLVEEDRLTLIDAGLPGNGGSILRYIHEIGRVPSQLDLIVVSHSHPDHTGPIKKLSQMTGASVAAHRGDTRFQAKTASSRLHYPGQPPSLGSNIPFLHAIPAHSLLEDGQVLPVMGGLQVLHTPGHTPGSVCLYLEEPGILFTGDTLLADGHCFRRPFPFPGTNFGDYRKSVERLATLPFEAAFVGHGTSFLQDARLRLQEMLGNYSWMAPRWDWLKRRSRSLIGY